jgi:hypothetical protein
MPKNIQEIIEITLSLAERFLKKQVEGVTSVKKDGDFWNVAVEVLERRAVPNSQDLLGKYEFKLDEAGELLAYKRTELRRRTDLVAEEEEV